MISFKNIFIFYMIIFIVTLVFIVLLILRKTIKPEQKNRKDSVKSGLGYYSTPLQINGIVLCLVEDAIRPGTEVSIQYCIPNSVTGKGCIDENGKISYNSVVRKNTMY